MADHNEPFGCDEVKLLRQAIHEYVITGDDTGIRCMYNEPLPPVSVDKLMRVDLPLSINDRRQIYAEIAKLKDEIKRRYTHEEVAAWLAEYSGRYRQTVLTEWVAQRRAEKAAAASGEG